MQRTVLCHSDTANNKSIPFSQASTLKQSTMYVQAVSTHKFLASVMWEFSQKSYATLMYCIAISTSHMFRTNFNNAHPVLSGKTREY